MKICKAGKRGLAGGRKEEEEGYVEEREDRILPSWTACFHSRSIARPPDKKKGRPHFSSKHFLCPFGNPSPSHSLGCSPKGPLSPTTFGRTEHRVSDKQSNSGCTVLGYLLLKGSSSVSKLGSFVYMFGNISDSC